MLSQTTPTQSEGKVYSLWELFEQYKVVVPLIQRGYAQGRKEASQIRNEFIKSLCESLSASEGYLELDYVYGKKITRKNSELQRLELFDGQQRLTTLYVLHWYCAMREKRLTEADARLKNFSYEVRPSSEDFFRFLCGQECRIAFENDFLTKKCTPSSIIKGHPAYNPAWERDSSIQGMLVTLDAIDKALKNIDTSHFFENLVGESSPIRFSFIPLDAKYGLSDNFYITMNSKGKALTPFEHFKGKFLKNLPDDASGERDTLAKKLDTAWLDLFWSSIPKSKVETDDIAKRVDDAYLNYFDVMSLILSTWDAGKAGTGRTRGAKAIETIYNESSRQQVFDRVNDFLIQNDTGNALYQVKGGNFEFFKNSLDSWKAKNSVFLNYCPFPLFGFEGKENPFDTICHKAYTNKDILLFFAVTLAFMGIDTIDTYKLRLRVVRNVLFYSGSGEIRAETMPVLLHDIYRIVHEGAIDNALRFNLDQKNDEIFKQDLRKNAPTLQQLCESLEDNDLLKGRLCLFGMNAQSLQANIVQHGNTFLKIFSSGNFKNSDIREAVNNCLLTFGDFSFQTGGDKRYQYCVKNVEQTIWHTILTDTSKWWNRNFSARSSCVIELCNLMHGVSEIDVHAQKHINSWLVNAEQKKELSWVYYFIKYPEIRNNGEKGIFRRRSNFDIILFWKERLSSWHCDPYLLAICSRVQNSIENPALKDIWHKGGYESLPLRIKSNKHTGTMRCVPEGWKLILENKKSPILYKIPKNADDTDKHDRIILGTKILKKVFGA